MNVHLHHTNTQMGAGVVASIASGVSFTEVSGVVGGLVVTILSLVTFALGIARNNRKNKQLAQRERRQLYRRGYLARDRELQPVVELESYWRRYIEEARRLSPSLPVPSPPTIVLAPAPPEYTPLEDDDDEGA